MKKNNDKLDYEIDKMTIILSLLVVIFLFIGWIVAGFIVFDMINSNSTNV